jgi:uncharacterized protein YbjT (DUF2867 family)
MQDVMASAEALTTVEGLAVVTLGEDRAPRLAFEGPTFDGLVRQAEAASASAQAGRHADALEELAALVGRLRLARESYERALAAQGVRVPYAP